MASLSLSHIRQRSVSQQPEPLIDETYDGTEVFNSEVVAPDEVYAEKMENILSGPPYLGVPPEPSCIANGVYVGTTAQGENLSLLKRMRITHVLNVDGFPLGLRTKRVNRYRGTGIVYEEYPIDDAEDFDIWPYFAISFDFINEARIAGRVLICDSGVSRSGAIAISFLLRDGKRLLDATQHYKNLRRVALSNRLWMEQLVTFARTYGLLDPDPDTVKTPRYGRKIDMYRLKASHLPLPWQL